MPNKKIKPAKCPLCKADLNHVKYKGTNIYSCEECPHISIEFIGDRDADNLVSYLKEPMKTKEQDAQITRLESILLTLAENPDIKQNLLSDINDFTDELAVAYFARIPDGDFQEACANEGKHMTYAEAREDCITYINKALEYEAELEGRAK